MVDIAGVETPKYSNTMGQTSAPISVSGLLKLNRRKHEK